MNTEKKTFYGHLFWQLLRADLCGFKTTFTGRTIDTIIWVSTTIAVTTYILPMLGVSAQFSFVILSGLVASGGIMAVYPNVVAMVADLEGDRVITYPLTLALPSWLVLIKNIIYFSITSAAYSFFVLPVGKILMWNHLSLTTISPLKFFIVFILSNLFCGVFALFLVGTIKNMNKLGHAWMRVVYPLWFLGGFQFTWHALHDVLPTLAYLNLLNPFVFIFEGTRAALLGQDAYLNFWVCCGALIAACLIFGISGIVMLKKRLDFV